MLANQWSNFVDAHLNGFLNEPFQAVDVFCGCNGNMDSVISFSVVFQFFKYSHLAGFIADFANLAGIKSSDTIGKKNPASLPEPENAGAMPRFFSVKLMKAGCYIFGVKKMNFSR